MDEMKPARKMSEKTRLQLESDLFAERCSLRAMVGQLSAGISPAHAVPVAEDAAKSARTIARIARRLAKAGGQ